MTQDERREVERVANELDALGYMVWKAYMHEDPVEAYSILPRVVCEADYLRDRLHRVLSVREDGWQPPKLSVWMADMDLVRRFEQVAAARGHSMEALAEEAIREFVGRCEQGW